VWQLQRFDETSETNTEVVYAIGNSPIIFVLSWMDYPGVYSETPVLTNDLDLKVSMGACACLCAHARVCVRVFIFALRACVYMFV
jgi:hypothetical protein